MCIRDRTRAVPTSCWPGPKNDRKSLCTGARPRPCRPHLQAATVAAHSQHFPIPMRKPRAHFGHHHFG
eukprot:10635179-Alexandrium_andersonii.AAC.1